MIIRKLEPEEYGTADRLESLSFVQPMPEAEDERKAYQADRWGCFDDSGRMHATFTNHDLPISFDGGIAPSGGVSGVASDPVSRGEGNVRALMRRVLQDDREAGRLFSTLYPFSHSFYRKFGYEICFDCQKACFPTKELAVFRAGDPPQARMLHPKDGLEALHPVYTAFARQYNLAVARDARTWARIKTGDPYKAETYYYLLSREGMDTAYAIFHYRPQDQQYIRTLCLTDYAFAGPEGFRDLMGFLHRYAAQAKDVEMFVPDTLPLSSLLPEPYVIHRTAGGRPMARVLDAGGVLMRMRYPREDVAFSVFVEDGFLPDNEGCYRVDYLKDYGVVVSRCEGEADLRVSVGAFTQLALGFLSLKEAAFRPDVQINGNGEALERVFVKKPVFLWDFY